MADYIERSTAIEAFENGEADVIEDWGDGCEFGFGLKNIRDTLNALPTADVAPVVRCKDCEKSDVTEFGKRYCKEPMGSCYGCIPVEDDYFCSGGRRKDGAE